MSENNLAKEFTSKYSFQIIFYLHCYMNLSELWELVMDREARRAAIHGVTKSRTRLSDWTELNWSLVSWNKQGEKVKVKV